DMANVREARLKEAAPFSRRARIDIEKEIDVQQRALEIELATGPVYLTRLRREIEESRRRLFPELLKARRNLAQADNDFKAANDSLRPRTAIIVLIMAFFLVSFLKPWLHHSPDASPTNPPPSARKYTGEDPIQKTDLEQSQRLCEVGKQLMAKGKFEEA